MYYSLGGAKLATVALDRELHDILFNSRPGQPDINQTNPGGVVHAWVGQIVTVPSDRPIAPFGPALVSVLPRVDRAVRTVSPAVFSHVRRAAVRACVCIDPLTDA